jgi:hypothetical protein
VIFRFRPTGSSDRVDQEWRFKAGEQRCVHHKSGRQLSARGGRPCGSGVACLSQRELAVAVCHDSFATFAELWVAAAVAHDAAHLLALEVAL